MRVTNRPEFSAWGKISWIPGISTLFGLGKLIQKIVSKIFSSNKEQSAPPKELKGRIQFWNDYKRSAIALIPVFGNACIIIHDCRAHRELCGLVNELRKAKGPAVESVFNQFPEEYRNYTFSMLDLVNENPEVLKYTPLADDPTFMLAVAKDNIKNLAYAPDTLMCNKTFIMDVVKAMRNQKVQSDWRVIKRNLSYQDLFTTFPQLIDTFKNDRDVMALMALENPALLKHATELMKDESFVLQTAEKIYQDGWERFSGRPGTKRCATAYAGPSSPFTILEYAPDLCKNEEFLLKVKKHPYMEPTKYASQELANNKEFILKMMKNYYTAGGWISGTGMSGIMLGSLVQTVPLKDIASKELKDDADFMQKAMEIDRASWAFASEHIKDQILKDHAFLRKHCNNFTVISEAMRRDPTAMEFASEALVKSYEFKHFVSNNLPKKVFDDLYGLEKPSAEVSAA